MRLVYVISFIALLTACNGNKENKNSDQPESRQYSRLILSKDSGFITKKNGLPFLLANTLSDTLESFWGQLKDNDTIGKYYKVKATGNYFYCSIDLSSKYTFETHLLIELTPEGDTVKSERYIHSNYSSCWNKRYDGFNRYGEFYGITTCGTGSGFYASYLYLFKEILPQDKQNFITQQCWSSFGGNGLSNNITSVMEWKNDQLIIHYTLEEGELDDHSNFNIKDSKRLDVTYRFIDNKWVTNDSVAVAQLSDHL